MRILYLFLFICALQFMGTAPSLLAQSKNVSETGYAQVIPATDNNKYQALHKTAPKGTIITVKNPSNQALVLVEVIGLLPNTGANDKVVIKLSEAAYKKINPGGDKTKKFGVELSYILR